MAGRRALHDVLSSARPQQCRLTHRKRGNARAVQDLRDRHRDGARSENGKGAKADQARPQLAAFWRSGLSFANMADNLTAARELFTKGGFAQVVHSDSPGVEESVVFDLNHAIEVLRGINKPIADAVHNEDSRSKLEALRVSLKSAATTAGDIIARSAGLTFGFNAMDGD
ncbi:MAG: imelysin family protein [Methyloceanibacter sp.]